MKTNPMTREPDDGEVVWLLLPAVMTADGVWNMERPAASNRWVDSADGWVSIPRDRFEVKWDGGGCSIIKADGSELSLEDARRAVEMLNTGKVRA